MKSKNLVNGPWFVGSLAVLLVNDHILKATAPALITGKLSDFAGLVMAPILIVGTIEFVSDRRQGQRTAWVVALCVAAVFASIKLHPGAADTYRIIMGSILGLANGFPIQQVNILHVADPWDLIALPAVAVSPLLAGRAERQHPTSPKQHQRSPSLRS
jgi:hypothetical protein